MDVIADNSSASAAKSIPAEAGRTPFGQELRIPEFDGVRGIAILLVFLFHVKPNEMSPFSGSVWDQICSPMWCGVDLFFVLSGFLITGILADTRQHARYFFNFYARRTVRIFPLYFGVLIGIFIVLPTLARIPESPLAKVVEGQYFQQLWSQQLWLWCYLQNFLQARGEHQLPGLGHFWSLAIEEQFYLFWPVVVYALSPRKMLWVSFLVAIFGYPLRLWMLNYGWDAWAIRHLTHARIDSLAAGGCVALLLRQRPPELLKRQALVVLAAAFVGLIMLWVVAPGLSRKTDSVTTWGYSVFAVFFAALVMLVALKGLPNFAVRILCNPALLIAGTYSYGIYMFHWPVVHASRAIIGRLRLPILMPGTVSGYLAEILLTLCVTLVAAVVSWKCYEQPFLRLKRYFSYHVA